MQSSPFSSYAGWCKETLATSLHNSLLQLPAARKQKLSQALYGLLFDYVHAPNSTILRLQQCYETRWCKPGMLSGSDFVGIANVAAERLLWLSKRVPPRVHAANVRMHFNAFHTARRYQVCDSCCLLCKLPNTEDSLEHLLHCAAVHKMLPLHLKTGTPPRVPPECFFMLAGDGKQRVAFACFVYGLCTIHNEIKHSGQTRDLKHQLFRCLVDLPWKKQIRTVWEELLGWYHPLQQPQPRHNRPSS
jgi:hypothetical protein